MEHAENVSLNGLGFDYLHPTMGEFLVTEVDGNTMKATIPDGTLYTVKGGSLTWRGPGWEFRMGGYSKVFDAASGTFQGRFDPGKTVIEELSPGKISITFKEGAPPGSLRANSSWADKLHFSGCRGKIIVRDCVLGASHDDAINVHGTHLHIVDQPEPNKMHPQTFGFDAFAVGDRIDYVSCKTLDPYAFNTLSGIKKPNEKEMELTLRQPNPGNIQPNDAVQNARRPPSTSATRFAATFPPGASRLPPESRC
ncbi:MAG: hypothetical protein V8Q21_05855 [Akkermansia muciniphila]